MDKILVIDDELSVSEEHPLRIKVAEFGKKYNYEAKFIEAPQPDKFQGVIDEYKPAAIFLDVVHNNKQANIARLLREFLGNRIPIVVLTNYTKSQLKTMNKDFERLAKSVKEKYSFISSIINVIKKSIEDPTLKRDLRTRMTKMLMMLEALNGRLDQYKDGLCEKKIILDEITSLLTELSKSSGEAANGLTNNLRELKVFLSSAKMPPLLGAGYPSDFRQGAAYFLKDKFDEEKTQSAILSHIRTNKNQAGDIDNSNYALIISPPMIEIRDKDDAFVGRYKSNPHCRIVQTIIKSKNHCAKFDKNTEKSRKCASAVNIGIKNATIFRLSEILKNAGDGMYKLDIGKIVYDDEVIKDFDQKKTIPDIQGQLSEIMKQLSNINKRIDKLENRHE